MANVWVGDNYYIKMVTHKTEDSIKYYTVNFQRLPESSYPVESQCSFRKSDVGSFPEGLSKEHFLANALPKMNAEMVIWDAATNIDTGWNVD